MFENFLQTSKFLNLKQTFLKIFQFILMILKIFGQTLIE